ncbi:MAG: Ig-like domain-containing protein, partial [Verrucomicrobiota bacterium]
GGPDPGEWLAEEVVVQNLRGSEVTDVRLELLAADPWVTLPAGRADPLRLPPGASRTNRLGYRLSKSAPCGQPVRLQLVARTGEWSRTSGIVRVVGRRLSPVLETNVWEASEGLPLRIPDLTAVEATQRLSTAGERVLEDVRVALRADHTTVGDLEIHLIHPDATEVALALHRGGDHPGLGTGECPRAVRTEYADEAAVPVRDGAVPFAGAFRPDEPLAVLRGRGLAGDWRLRLADTYDDDFGILRCWSLTTVSRAVETRCVVFQSSPAATNQYLNIPAGAPWTGRLAGGDPDGDPVRFVVDTPPARGQVAILNEATGEFRYQPDAGFIGEDSWTCRVLDAAGAGPSARVTLRVGLPEPSTPVLEDYSVDATGVFQLRHRNGSPVARVLEASPDLRQWWPVARVESGLELNYAGPTAAEGTGWFFRLR